MDDHKKKIDSWLLISFFVFLIFCLPLANKFLSTGESQFVDFSGKVESINKGYCDSKGLDFLNNLSLGSKEKCIFYKFLASDMNQYELKLKVNETQPPFKVGDQVRAKIKYKLLFSGGRMFESMEVLP